MKRHFEREKRVSSPVTSSGPSRVAMLGYPNDVLSHPGLADSEKRSILASWASDARAVENAPALRQLDNGAVVSVDEILQALRALDHAEPAAEAGYSGSQRLQPSAEHTPRRIWHLRRRPLDWIKRDDHDDDPPPCPASAALPISRTIVAAVGREIIRPAPA
jgi:hypothetical protein